MVNYCADVQAFQAKFELPMPSEFTFVSGELFDFRVKFFLEEAREYGDAYASGDLPEAVDALIDLVYITCGCALLHGIDPVKFEAMLDAHTIPHGYLLQNLSTAEPLGRPHLLAPPNHRLLVRLLSDNVDQLTDGWQRRDEQGVKNGLTALYLNSLYASYLMGFSDAQWNELWTDVQRANMAKERVARAEDSKRGSTYDVRKPEGWVPPRTQELVQRFLTGG